MFNRLLTICTLLMLALANSSATLIDRVAITVGTRIITELRLDEEIRVTALLNHQSVVRDVATRRAAADRLVQRMLIEREMQVNHYPEPGEAEVELYVGEIQKNLMSGNGLNSQLAAYQITETALRQHLISQLMVLKFIEFRFRPDVEISEGEVQAYYDREVASAAEAHTGSPRPFKDSEETIRQTLSEQSIDASLSQWIEETRKQLSIIYQDKSLQ